MSAGAGRKPAGFSLTEVLVSVAVLGTIMVIAVPRYINSAENARAYKAAALGKMIAAANRAYRLDRGRYVDIGAIDNSCNSRSCQTGSDPACNLVACGYLQGQSLERTGYTFQTIQGPSGSRSPPGCLAPPQALIEVRRCGGASPCASAGPYSNWAYVVTTDGRAVACGSMMAPTAQTFCVNMGHFFGRVCYTFQRSAPQPHGPGASFQGPPEVDR